MSLAIWVFIRSMKQEKSFVDTDVYEMITADANALLKINRPSVFDRMILANQSLNKVFSSEIPPAFLSIIQQERQIQSVIFSFHPQGVICFIMAPHKAIQSLEEHILPSLFYDYSPMQQERDNIQYKYYPDTAGLFLSSYSSHTLWVGSYSRKLLERTINDQTVEVTTPADITHFRGSFDPTALMNIIYPVSDLDLYVSLDNSREWRLSDKWLAADLFMSDDNFCCYGSLPYYSRVSASAYKAMGDTISKRINNLYPEISFSFQMNKEEESIYFTGCSPVKEN